MKVDLAIKNILTLQDQKDDDLRGRLSAISGESSMQPLLLGPSILMEPIQSGARMHGDNLSKHRILRWAQLQKIKRDIWKKAAELRLAEMNRLAIENGKLKEALKFYAMSKDNHIALKALGFTMDVDGKFVSGAVDDRMGVSRR
jgi:hypothetical protein